MAELEAAKRMTDAGRAVFEARKDAGSPGYRAEKKVGALDMTRLQAFKTNELAWKFFESSAARLSEGSGVVGHARQTGRDA